MTEHCARTAGQHLRFLVMFRSDRFADVSLNQWLALTPPDLVREHLCLGEGAMRALTPGERPVLR